jgi:hypothetical protein
MVPIPILNVVENTDDRADMIGIIVIQQVPENQSVILPYAAVVPIIEKFGNNFEIVPIPSQLNIDGHIFIVTICKCIQYREANSPEFNPADRLIVISPELDTQMRNCGV